jgi:capsular polysaccharide transport system permease protein
MQAIPILPPRRARPRFQRLRVITALVLRGMDTRFGRSAGGYLWAVAEPLGGIILLALVFSLALRTPPMGTSFLLFYATGIIPFRMFNGMSSAVSSAIASNRGLLAYPVVDPLDAVFAKFALSFMTDLLVAALLYSGIIRFIGIPVKLDLGAIAEAFVLTALLGLGIGTLNCVLFGLLPTWKNVWSVLTRPLFLLSGIFYIFESVPASFQHIMWYNPIVHVIGMMRSGFYGFYRPDYISVPYVLGIAGFTFVVGGALLRRHASALIEGE